MIPFDFAYYKPASMLEAYQLFQELDRSGKHPVYFSGGTEIITLGRVNRFYTNAVIDLKGISECTVMDCDDRFFYVGSALELAKIEEANAFPLLSKVSKELADLTSRRKITLGGNICGNIPYREAVLPFLLAESYVITFGKNGIKSRSIRELFDQELQLEHGEFLVQLISDIKYVSAPYVSIKRRKQWDTGYPVVSLASLKINNEIRVAISGVSPYPFRNEKLEYYLNRLDLSKDNRVSLALTNLQEPIVSGTEGSSEYKRFVLKNALVDALEAMEGV